MREAGGSDTADRGDGQIPGRRVMMAAGAADAYPT
jgi:hypothetical protein